MVIIMNRKKLLQYTEIFLLSACAIILGLFTLGDAASELEGVVWGAFITALNYIFDYTNPNSMISVLYNYLPLVGTHPISESSFIYLGAGIGAVVLYRKYMG